MEKYLINKLFKKALRDIKNTISEQKKVYLK